MRGFGGMVSLIFARKIQLISESQTVHVGESIGRAESLANHPFLDD
jgi:cystathionine beta-lyase/cystathionine gamma-synthase